MNNKDQNKGTQTITTRNDKGVVKSKISAINGVKNGPCRFYNEDGTLHSYIFFVDGVIV